jgi:hypothetical protein
MMKTLITDRSAFRARTALRSSLVVGAVIVFAAATMASTGTAVLVLEVAAAVVVGCVAIFLLTSLVTAALLALAVRRGLRRMLPLELLDEQGAPQPAEMTGPATT